MVSRNASMRRELWPVAVEPTYAWTEASGRAARMTLRHRGESWRLSRLSTAMLGSAMPRANCGDLDRLSLNVAVTRPSQRPCAKSRFWASVPCGPRSSTVQLSGVVKRAA
jgi:hypothetical protein